MEQRTCPKCGATKPYTNEFFPIHKKGRLHKQCKTCVNARLREFWSRPENAEKNRGRKAGYTPPPQSAEAKARISAQRKQRRLANLEKRRAYDRAAQKRRYLKLRAQGVTSFWTPAASARRKARRHMDPALRLNGNMARSMNKYLRGAKGSHWEDLIGYSFTELKDHLERQFRKGMTWDNYGSHWHVDHIVPASSFKFTSPADPEFKACWALTNLRPLWKPDNIKKRNNRTHLL